MNQLNAPLYQALTKHMEKSPVSFHVPGHKNGQITPDEFFEQFLKIDVTELTGLDDLHDPEGPILEAETLLSELFATKRSFFLINGSTVGNLAMIMAACGTGDTVLVQRNCHKSVMNGLSLAKARPVFLEPEYDIDWKVASGISLETVKSAIQLHPDAKAIILTYPNYYGMTYPLKEIIDHAHEKQIPVLIDEAHGPHFILGEPFPASATQLGADVVVQSAHKTLPAMTMGSYLHFNSKLIDLKRITEYLHLLQSSSPSYPIMASLDLARRYLAAYNDQDVLFLKNRIDSFKAHLGKIPAIRVMEQMQADPLKVTIQTNCALSGLEIQRLLEADGIFTELADPNNVLFILPLLKENHPYPLEETAEKIQRVLKEFPLVRKQKVQHQTDKKISELAISFEEMENYNKFDRSIRSSLNYISAETIIPYPPGIPLLLKGEQITEHKIDNLMALMEAGARFQGGASLEEGTIKVFGGIKNE